MGRSTASQVRWSEVMQLSASFPPAHETTSLLIWGSQGISQILSPSCVRVAGLKIDVGRVHCGHSRTWFLEGVALGLLSDLYPMADDIQHGKLAQVGGLLSTLISATPSRLRMVLDDHKHLATMAHMLLITNMPFLGPHFQISPNVSFKDGRLDVFTFSDMSKLNMLSYAMLSRGDSLEDVGIMHYRAKHVTLVSNPQMPVLADGILLGQGSLSVHVYPRALTVMAGTELTGQSATTVAVNPKVAPDE